jgi:hypothetical protein
MQIGNGLASFRQGIKMVSVIGDAMLLLPVRSLSGLRCSTLCDEYRIVRRIR